MMTLEHNQLFRDSKAKTQTVKYKEDHCIKGRLKRKHML